MIQTMYLCPKTDKMSVSVCLFVILTTKIITVGNIFDDLLGDTPYYYYLCKE